MGATNVSIFALALLIWFGGMIPGTAAVPRWIERLIVWVQPELRSLDAKRKLLDDELMLLPVPAGTNSGIRRGFQTGRIREGEDLWVELVLPEPVEAEKVVMIPMLGKGGHGDVAGYGFPSRFQLEASDEDGETYLLMDETADDFPNPGIYPVIANCPPGIKIARIRLTATQPWMRGGPEVLALAEMMVLSGNRNFAAGGRVLASSSREMWPTWSTGNLTDMSTPLGLPVAPGAGGLVGWHSEVSPVKDRLKSLTVDLGQVMPIDTIQLAPVWKPGMPSSFNYGFPSRFKVETATSADFSDRQVIYDRTTRSLETPGQNLQCFEVGGIPVRYIRIATTRMRERSGDYVFALSELMAYKGGRNVALGAKVISEESIEDREWGRAGLTDGMTGGGRFLGLLEWLEGLARRRIIENRLSVIDTRREEMLEHGEKVLVTGSVGTTFGLGLTAMFFAWRSKRQRRIDRERHRERLARDLHDELGSNLGSIALISSFALEGESDEKQMRGDMAEIELVARESADSMRDLVELLGGRHRGAGSDWLEVLQGLAERLLRGVELDCRLTGASWTREPDLETRREIYLFCKEVLHNIARHANATHVRFHIRPNNDGLRVEIADDGRGFDPELVKTGHGLRNFRDRAAGLHATLGLESTPGKGTLVTLDVPRGRRWRKPKPIKHP